MKDFDPKKPSKGLGDIIAKVTHALGIDKLADKVAQALGHEDCGCDSRRELLNTLVSYKRKENTMSYLYTTVQDITDKAGTIYKAGETIYIDETHPLNSDLELLLSEGKIKPQE